MKAYFLAISVFLGVWNVKAQDISVSVGTTIPYQHYAGITLETNRLDVSYNAGILIPPYSDMILNILDDIGVDEVYINLLDASYQFGFTNSLGLNYKMGKNRRWYVGANFRIDHLTASDTPSDLIEIVTGETLNMEQSISLAIIDQGWKEHLREMDELKEQVQNARYEQKDPLVIYKFEAFELFKGFIGTIASDIVNFLSKANIAVNDPNEVQNARNIRKQRASQRVRESKADSGSILSGGGRAAQPQAPRQEVEITKPRQVTKTIGRNDKVTVKYTDGTTKKAVKYKTVEKDVIANKCVIVES